MVRAAKGGGAIAAILLASALPARADFTVCNDSFDVINLAVGHATADGFATRGWWTIGTNRCAVVLRGTLSTRYMYVYATDVLGQPVLDGDTPLCISEGRFEIMGGEACWQRGHIAAPFAEIDTGAATRWTLFIGD